MNLQAKKSGRKYNGTMETHISSLSLAVVADGKKGKKYIAVGMLKGLLVQIKIHRRIEMRFKEYVEQKIGKEIDHDDWIENYDGYEMEYFQNYLDDMKMQGYEIEFGYDYL